MPAITVPAWPIMTVTILIAIVAGGASLAGTPADQCSRTQAALESELDRAWTAKEPEDSLKWIFSDATGATERCPEAEGLAYVLVRSGELGRGVFLGNLPENAPPELPGLAAAAAKKFPWSARILTVDARVTRDVEVARLAVAADPAYVPARVVLADILVQSGDWSSAEEILAKTSRLNATNDGLVVWALVELEKGDPRSALAKANQALKGPRLPSIEPDARDPRPAMRAGAVAARAALALRRFDAAAGYLMWANPEDPLVRDLLKDPPPELAKALKARRKRRPRTP